MLSEILVSYFIIVMSIGDINMNSANSHNNENNHNVNEDDIWMDDENDNQNGNLNDKAMLDKEWNKLEDKFTDVSE